MDQWVKIKSKKKDNQMIMKQLKENQKLLLEIQVQLKKHETMIKNLKFKEKPRSIYPLSILDIINLQNIEPIEKPNL